MSDRRRVWLVLPEALAMRVFFDCGIVDGLRERLGDDRLQLVSLLPPEQTRAWTGDLPVTYRDELLPWAAPPLEKARRRLDRWLDARIGYFPLAIRLNLRHGFHLERMRPGHPNFGLDLARRGPLPSSPAVERRMLEWHFGRRRYIPSALLRRMGASCAGILYANVQTQPVVPFLLAARRLGLPQVGYVGSWDHTVGKGVIAPHLERYVVQNAVMQRDLERYHGIPADRVTVTGWPQTDVFHRPRPRAAYDAYLRSVGLDPARPLVLAMGNTPTNAPYEHRFVERLTAWQQERAGELSLLFRPHPRDRDWEARFAAARDREGIAVQPPSYTDLEVLATLLQHGSCVVANAGTIVLDSLVNDRPTVCVLYDEGAPAGEAWAAQNVLGEHYRQLMESTAFYRAHDFAEVAAGIERALRDPGELAGERRRVAAEVVGPVDGRAAERVVDAVAAVLEDAA